MSFFDKSDTAGILLYIINFGTVSVYGQKISSNGLISRGSTVIEYSNYVLCTPEISPRYCRQT